MVRPSSDHSKTDVQPWLLFRHFHCWEKTSQRTWLVATFCVPSPNVSKFSFGWINILEVRFRLVWILPCVQVWALVLQWNMIGPLTTEVDWNEGTRVAPVYLLFMSKIRSRLWTKFDFSGQARTEIIALLLLELPQTEIPEYRSEIDWPMRTHTSTLRMTWRALLLSFHRILLGSGFYWWVLAHEGLSCWGKHQQRLRTFSARTTWNASKVQPWKHRFESFRAVGWLLWCQFLSYETTIKK